MRLEAVYRMDQRLIRPLFGTSLATISLQDPPTMPFSPDLIGCLSDSRQAAKLAK